MIISKYYVNVNKKASIFSKKKSLKQLLQTFESCYFPVWGAGSSFHTKNITIAMPTKISSAYTVGKEKNHVVTRRNPPSTVENSLIPIMAPITIKATLINVIYSTFPSYRLSVSMYLYTKKMIRQMTNTLAMMSILIWKRTRATATKIPTIVHVIPMNALSTKAAAITKAIVKMVPNILFTSLNYGT